MLQYDVHDIRTTVCDVMMMYYKERYMENLLKEVGRGKRGKSGRSCNILVTLLPLGGKRE